MSNATTSRKSVKPARSIRLVIALNDQGKNGLVRITVGKESGDYLLSRIPTDLGEAFRLDKAVSGETYDVLLADDQGHSCDCKGFSRWGHCKHTAGLLALRAAGRL